MIETNEATGAKVEDLGPVTCSTCNDKGTVHLNGSDRPESPCPDCIEVLDLTVPIRCTFDPDRRANSLFMGCGAGATVSVEGKKIGSVDACLGGGVMLHDEESGKTWYLGARELWTAFRDAQDDAC